MLNGRAGDIKRHKWFDGLDWDALEARKMEPPRQPKEDSAKRLRELTVSGPSPCFCKSAHHTDCTCRPLLIYCGMLSVCNHCLPCFCCCFATN